MQKTVVMAPPFFFAILEKKTVKTKNIETRSRDAKKRLSFGKAVLARLEAAIGKRNSVNWGIDLTSNVTK